MQMFWDEEATEIDKRRKALDDDFQKLLSELMNDYRKEIEKHLPSLEKELKAAIKYDAFGNVITQEGKDEEVWSYFAQKNLWENIFSKGYNAKQARYLNRLEDFLSDTIDNPDKHLESFGHGLLWRYYAKVSAADGSIVYDYMKTDDPLAPLALTLKTLYADLKSTHKEE